MVKAQTTQPFHTGNDRPQNHDNTIVSGLVMTGQHVMVWYVTTVLGKIRLAELFGKYFIFKALTFHVIH